MSEKKDNTCNPFGILHFNLVKALCKKQMTAHLLFIHYVSARSHARDKKNFKPWVFNAADIYTTCDLNRGFVKALSAAFVKANIFKLAGNTRKGSPRFELNWPAFQNYIKGEIPLEPIDDKKEADKYLNPTKMPPLPADGTCAMAAQVSVLPLHRKPPFPVQPLHTDNKDTEKEESTSKTASCLFTTSHPENERESPKESASHSFGSPVIYSVTDGAGSSSLLANGTKSTAVEPVTDASGSPQSVIPLPVAPVAKPSEAPNPFVSPLFASAGPLSAMTAEQREKVLAEIKKKRDLEQERLRFEQLEYYRKHNQEREYTKQYWARARENYSKDLRDRMTNRDLSPVQKVQALKDLIKALNNTGVYVSCEIVNCVMFRDSKAYPINFTWNQKGLNLAKRFFQANPTLAVQDVEAVLMDCCRYAVVNPLNGYDAVGFHLVKGAETLTFFINNLEIINANNLVRQKLPDSTVFIKLNEVEKVELPERQEDLDLIKAVG